MRFTLTTAADVPAPTAWSFISDYGQDARWRREVVSMQADPPGPPAPGTVTTEVARVLGSTFTTPGEVLAVDAGRSLEWRASSPAVDAWGRRRVEALGPDRCRISLDYDLRTKGLNRLLAPLLHPAFRRTVRRNLRGLPALLRDHQPRNPVAVTAGVAVRAAGPRG